VLGGKTNREIAELMSLSARTVEFHRANLMSKLDVANLNDLVATVRRRGWMRALLPPGPTPSRTQGSPFERQPAHSKRSPI
jgi:hypothetical protein